MQVNGVQNYQGQNCSFRNLKIKNPKKMSNEMLEALIGVKDIFADYPNASVRLKHFSYIDGIDHYHSGSYPGTLKYYSFRRLNSKLIFDLGEKYKGNSLKFSLTERNHHCFKGSFTDALFCPIFCRTADLKETNIKDMLSKITSENILEKIQDLKQRIDNELDEIAYRKNLLKRANS